MANQEDAERLKHSIQEWNQWRQEHPEIQPDLSKTNLSDANLTGANLSHAKLFRADLTGANLTGVDLTRAHLLKADLTRVDLTRANLSHANLYWTVLSEADLTGTHFAGTCFWHTFFVQIDLSNVKGLETANHNGPSTVNINSVVLPHDEQTRTHFLRGVGFSDTFIEYLPSILAPAAIQYYSLFIAYANSDETLARRLYQDLQNKGVRCWMAPYDLCPGDYHHSRIDEAIHLHEKTLLLLSEHAVNSSWVKHEVQVALAREIDQDCTVLFPLRLDEAIMQTDKDWAVRLRKARHIGDFTNWQDDAAYNQAFTTLLRHLKVNRPPTM